MLFGIILSFALVGVCLVGLSAVLTERAETRARERRRHVNDLVPAEDGFNGDIFSLGVYLAGHPDIQSATEICGVSTSADLILLNADCSKVVGRIPLDAITNAQVLDNSKTHHYVTTRVTATRLALMGPFALAVPKRAQSQTTTLDKNLVVDWHLNGVSLATVFRFRTANELVQSVVDQQASQAQWKIMKLMLWVAGGRVGDPYPLQ